MPLFDESDPKTDLVIVSRSDGRRFYVYEAIICLASPVLKERVLAIDRGLSDGDRPVLTLDEPGPVLESLFQLCYPVRVPSFPSVDTLEPVLKAALDYSMEGPSEHLLQTLSGVLLPQFPIAVYACACRLQLEQEARMSERWEPSVTSSRNGKKSRTLAAHSPLTWSVLANTDLLDDINAFDFIRVLQDNVSGLPYSWMHENISPAIIEAAGIFLPSAFGDVVLKSSDGIEFHVSMTMLSFASPFFRDMFTLPQSHTASYDHSIVPMSESSSTLDLLLRVCYPPCNETPKDLYTLMNTLAAAMKYEMDAAFAYLKKKLMVTFGATDPVDVYIVCCCLQIEKEAKAAGKLCLGMKLASLDKSRWRWTRAIHYKRLKKYHMACGEAAATAVKLEGPHWLPSWYTYDATTAWTTCTYTYCNGALWVNGNGTVRVKVWWEEYMTKIGRLLKESPLSKSIATQDDLIRTIPPSSTTCSECGPRLLQDLVKMGDFCKQLVKEVEKRVDKVAF